MTRANSFLIWSKPSRSLRMDSRSSLPMGGPAGVVVGAPAGETSSVDAIRGANTFSGMTVLSLVFGRGEPRCVSTRVLTHLGSPSASGLSLINRQRAVLQLQDSQVGRGGEDRSDVA